jgi:hypothetical protein
MELVLDMQCEHENSIVIYETNQLRFVVVTTIQPPTPAVMCMVEKAAQNEFRLIIVGDRKTPCSAWAQKSVYFLSLTEQCALDYKLSAMLPENHYARKNLGYLLAMTRGAEVIFDTDDDNAPMASWTRREEVVPAQLCTQSGWVNAYQWFTREYVWPRGFPLGRIRAGEEPLQLGLIEKVKAPVQQGLANGSPDVDAVWRLTLEKDIIFQDRVSVMLQEGAWCPFNSQCTWWFPQAFPLLYLPSFVSFRMTDIWRSFIAQRCLWEMRLGVVFHGPEMVQDRNPHNLLRDFEQEIPGYLGNAHLCDTLEKVQLSSRSDAIASNLHRCYEALIRAGFMLSKEIKLVESWLIDLEACR